MRPFFGAGFGTFSRVLGPFTDYFPSSGGAFQENSQFGVALGTKIQAGGDGATVTRVIVDSPKSIAGTTTSPMNWRLLILKGDMDERRLWNALDNEFQLATNGWPRKGSSDLSLPVLFEKIIGNQRANDGYGSGTTDEPVLDFGDEGPNVGSNEVMTAFLTPLFNATGVPGYGSLNFAFINFSIFGRYSRNPLVLGGGGKDTNQRSMPRGTISGI